MTMAQIIIDLTDTQQARVLRAYGVQLGLGRDATPPEIADLIKSHLKDTTLAIEYNKAVEQVGAGVLPWE
jgi:hypothetical protein